MDGERVMLSLSKATWDNFVSETQRLEDAYFTLTRTDVAAPAYPSNHHNYIQAAKRLNNTLANVCAELREMKR